MEELGGTIWVESSQGIGSTFSFTLPAAHAASVPELASESMRANHVDWRFYRLWQFSVEITIYISPGNGGREIGSVLYSHLFPTLQTLGIHAAMGGIALPNEASVALHEKFGLEKVAHFQQVGFKFNQWVSMLDTGSGYFKNCPGQGEQDFGLNSGRQK